MRLPDRDVVYYEALIKRAAETLDSEAFDYAAATEPESHVFSGDAYESGYDDPDEYREIVMEIGSRDLGEKIAHWEKAILSGDEFVASGYDPIQRAEMAVGA